MPMGRYHSDSGASPYSAPEHRKQGGMALDEIIASFPILATVVGAQWLRTHPEAVEFIEERIPWYQRLENDFGRLQSAGISDAKLIGSYRSSVRIRAETQKTIYEVHAAALLSRAAASIDIHVPRGDGSNRNFDIRVEVEGVTLAVESKTRKDEFPFNMPEDGDGIRGGSRSTLDLHDAVELGFPPGGPADSNHKPTPESTVIKQTLQEALAQLPTGGCNVVVFGQIEGDLHNLVDALFGTEYVEDRLNPQTGEFTTRWVRAPNGAFNSPGGEFNSLSGVIWFRLWRDGDEMKVVYRGFRNPNAQHPLPENVRVRLDELLFDRSSKEAED